MIFLDLFRILLFSIRIKNVFIQMFIREIISEKLPNDGKTIILKKRIYQSYPFKEVSLQINILFHQKLIFWNTLSENALIGKWAISWTKSTGWLTIILKIDVLTYAWNQRTGNRLRSEPGTVRNGVERRQEGSGDPTGA